MLMNEFKRSFIILTFKRIFIAAMCIVMVCGCIEPVMAKASDNDTKTVRIGWYEQDMFQEGMSDDEVKSGYSYEYIQKVADYTSWQYEYVYGTWSELYDKLVNGEIDLLAGVSKTSEREDDLLFPDSEMGIDNYYLAVSGSRSDLLDELNYALDTMMSIDPYILQTLRYQTYGSVLSDTSLSDEEKIWLSKHSTIKIGYIDSYLPYSDTNSDGEAEGLVIDALKNAFAVLKIDKVPQMEFTAYDNYEDLVTALNNDDIDIAFPVANDSWQLEQDGINASSEVVSDSGTLFYKNAVSKNDIHTLAVNENNELQIKYSKREYPNAELLYYSDIDECLRAVLKGEADGTIMDTLRVRYVTNNSRYNKLAYVQLSASTGKCFGVKSGNTALLLLLNHAIEVLGSSYGIDYSYQYIASFYSYGVRDFLREYHLAIVAIFVIIVAIIVIHLIFSLQRKEQEVEIREQLQRRAEVANDAKSNFLFNMSHDIRTPMNAVLGFAGLMENELDDPDKLKDHLSKIKMSGEYLLGIINNVLEVARIDSGRETLDENFMDLLDEKYSSMFEGDISRKHLKFTKELHVEHRYVYADAQKIREVMLNLLSNAIKYTPEGGSIGLTLRELPSVRDGYAAYAASVFDTGIGMTKEFQQEIFESFTRERNTTESKVVGTGLGMSIVKKLVDLMDGVVAVDSAPGKGSTFTVTVELRIADNPEQVLEKSHSDDTVGEDDLTGKCILMAEDNDLNAEIAISILEDAGAKVERASDGVECVNMVTGTKAGHYDLILMDIQMPNLNGYDAARRIRKLDDSVKASIPIIAMTANAFDEDRKNALDAGMNGHLAKPIDINIMARTLSEVFNSAEEQ